MGVGARAEYLDATLYDSVARFTVGVCGLWSVLGLEVEVGVACGSEGASGPPLSAAAATGARPRPAWPTSSAPPRSTFTASTPTTPDTPWSLYRSKSHRCSSRHVSVLVDGAAEAAAA